MNDWAKPKSITEWFKRLFSPISLILIFMGAGIIVSELRFDWAEMVIGSYLNTTNTQRPESGAIWETGKKAVRARENLEQIVTDLEDSRKNAMKAESFREVLGQIKPGKWATLTPAHFRKLYLKLPHKAAETFLPGIELLSDITSGKWIRTYIDKPDGSLRIYFLDSKNRVIRRMELTSEWLVNVEENLENSATNLDLLPEFTQRIYDAGVFFQAAESLPRELAREIISSPAKLLRQPGKLLRVGISDVTSEGLIRLGFEYSQGDTKKIVFITGGEIAVWNLRNFLEGANAIVSGETMEVTDQDIP